MGASCWKVSVPWQSDLAQALSAAREQAYQDVSNADRAKIERLSDKQLLRSIELDPDDDEDAWNAWSAWLSAAPASTRYALSRAPAGGVGSILDIDHLDATVAKEHVRLEGNVNLQLVAPVPQLGGVRWATDDEVSAWFGVERADVNDADIDPFDAIERGQAIAVTLWEAGEPRQIVFFGVTGD